jgi:hypothetical protein
MDFNSDFRYDLALGQLGESFVAQLFQSKTVEVKFDFGTHRTGNFYIEYESRGIPSGIATTQADYWMLIAATEKGCRHKEELGEIEKDDVMYCIFMHVDELKLRCRKNYYRKGVHGGDDNTSLGILIKVEHLFLGTTQSFRRS